eukprot:c8436_g1_i2.p2 GENE.c8436_g1_i2~~c8436_g1_i2.p2  ORF type:complete len:234 (+),score=46.78 c8436_g1_i2:437-1138(+)
MRSFAAQALYSTRKQCHHTCVICSACHKHHPHIALRIFLPTQKTSEGVEVTIATHLVFGSHLLTTLALPLLQKSSDPRVIVVSSGGMYNTKFPTWDVATSESGKYSGSMAYSYAKRGQVLLCEEWTKQHQNIKFVTCHPGWTDTPGVDSAFGESKKHLEPLRSLFQGSEGIVWLAAVPSAEIEGGAFYLDRSPQRKHLSGPFFSDGSFTKNTPEEVADMMRHLESLSTPASSS